MFFILTFLISTCQGQSQYECSDSELQEVQSQFNKCTVELEYQFEDTRDTFPNVTYVEVSGFIHLVSSKNHFHKRCFYNTLLWVI